MPPVGTCSMRAQSGRHSKLTAHPNRTPALPSQVSIHRQSAALPALLLPKPAVSRSLPSHACAQPPLFLASAHARPPGYLSGTGQGPSLLAATWTPPEKKNTGYQLYTHLATAPGSGMANYSPTHPPTPKTTHRCGPRPPGG